MYENPAQFVKNNYREWLNMSKKNLMYVAVFLAGVVLAGRVRALPVVGSKIPTL